MLARLRGLELAGAGAPLLRLGLTVLRRRRGYELLEEMVRGVGDGVDRTREGLLVRARRLVETADLAHVLESRGVDLVVGRLGLEVVERLDVSAHGASLAGRARPFTPPEKPLRYKKDLWARSSSKSACPWTATSPAPSRPSRSRSERTATSSTNGLSRRKPGASNMASKGAMRTRTRRWSRKASRP